MWKLVESRWLRWGLMLVLLNVQFGCVDKAEMSLPKEKLVSNVLQTNTSLTSSSQILKRGSLQKANASVIIDLKARTLSAQILLANLGVTAAHIRQGVEGEVGGIVAAFEGAPDIERMEVSDFHLARANSEVACRRTL